jgi:two-component SAPR family response regulator
VNSQFKILIIDDEIELTEILSSILSKDDRFIKTAHSGMSAFEITQVYTFDLIICDLSMPQMSGISFFEKAREIQITCPVIFLTGHYDHFSEAINLDKYGVYLFGKTQLHSLMKKVDELIESPPSNYSLTHIESAIATLSSLKARS